MAKDDYPVFVEPQTGILARDVLWKGVRIKDVMVMRVDDKAFTGLITKCVENAK